MKIIIGVWRICQSTYYGYMVQRKVGVQWKHSSYFPDLEKAVDYLYFQALNNTNSEVIISKCAPEEFQSLYAAIRSAKQEIIGAINAKR